jgi:putative tryptophan/tyrosine transport system substrate-binding protein
MLDLRRREFIRLVGGAAAWPLAARAALASEASGQRGDSNVRAPDTRPEPGSSARAQSDRKVVRIGFLGPSSAPLERHLVDAFRQKLQELGYVDGQNMSIEYRWAEGRDDQLPRLAAELTRAKPDVIVTAGTPGTLAAKDATKTIPVVFASSGNPVNAGIAASYARPGGNVTGFTILGPELEGKRVQLLQAVPAAARIGVLELGQPWRLRLLSPVAGRGGSIETHAAAHGGSSPNR